MRSITCVTRAQDIHRLANNFCGQVHNGDFGFFAFDVGVVLCAYGVGLSLFSYWFISVPPVRGAPTFLCLPQRKVGKRKRLYTASAKRVPRAVTVVEHLESVFSHTPRQ